MNGCGEGSLRAQTLLKLSIGPQLPIAPRVQLKVSRMRPCGGQRALVAAQGQQAERWPPGACSDSWAQAALRGRWAAPAPSAGGMWRLAWS